MSSKKPAAKPKTSSSSKKTVEDLFADIDDTSDSTATPSTAPAAAAAATKPKARGDEEDDEEKRLMAELEGLTAEKRTPSRSGTPRLSSGNPRSSSDLRRERASFEDRKTVTTASDHHVPEEKGESSTTYNEKSSAGPAASAAAPAEGGGWWGGLWSTASAAVNTAQGVYKEIQSSEETKKWSEQVKGNVQALRGLGGELQKRAMPTFSTLLSHIAPPISSHERLRIHTTHDLMNYPSIDPIVYNVFNRVMQQVDGGELIVIQRGSESTKKSNTADSLGWGGGPWWRDEQRKRDMNVCSGVQEGVKLAKANAQGYADEYLGKTPSSPTAVKKDGGMGGGGEGGDEANPIRKSDVFLAVQALTYPTPDFMAATSPSKPAKTSEDDEEDEDEEDEEDEEELLAFALHLTDPAHKLSFTTVSQSVPGKWGAWLDGTFDELPEDVQASLAAGAVDPREWIAEWIEETLALAVGVVAQSYVSKRMGVGEGMGKGKAPARTSAEMAGEETRAAT